MRNKKAVFIIFLTFVCLFSYTETEKKILAEEKQINESSYVIFSEENTPLYFGNPDKAEPDVSSFKNYLIQKKQYTLSYNYSSFIPNWVMWHLSEEDFGTVSRGNDFRPDPDIPAQWYALQKSDYCFSKYGFDRGHLCPSADRTASKEDNKATFYMTNMIPQSPDCNRIVWKDLEVFSRNLAKNGKELYIAAGSYGKGGISGAGYFETIKLKESTSSGFDEITIPAFCWKIIMVLDKGDNDLERVSADTVLIAVFMPNGQGIGNNGSWEQYITTTDFIEEKTGFDFFELLPDEIEDIIEGKKYEFSP